MTQLGFILPRPNVCPDRRTLAELAQAAEGLGYSYARLFDHVVGADPDQHELSGPYGVDDPFYEPFVTGGFLAGVTGLGLVTGVLVLPQRQTVLVAKQAAELDRMLEGRLRLGVGLGWNEVAYSSLGSEFRGRAARLEEQLAVLRELWTERTVTRDGRWHRLEGVGVNPLPVQRPVPVWIGCGDDPRSLDRVARLADGWMPSPFLTPAQIRTGWDEIRRLAEKHDRDPSEIGLEGRVDCPSPATTISEAAAFWASLEATHLTVKTVDPPAGGFSTEVPDPAHHLACLRHAVAQLRGETCAPSTGGAAGAKTEELRRRLASLEDEREILDVLHRYGHAIDYGREDEWRDCFHREALWESRRAGREPTRLAGHAELAAFAARHTRAPDKFHKHVVVDARVQLHGDEATAQSYFLRIDKDEAGGRSYIWAMGRYLDELVRCGDGRWRIRRRVAEIED